jgi:uncharacterized LabA/DUF88 family protein
VYEEKETDVNIAIAMIKDAAQDVYDTAILVSGDTDLRCVRINGSSWRFLHDDIPRH